MDPITIGLLAGAGLGVLKGNRNSKANEAQDKYRKVAMAYSPWTGLGDVGGGTAPGMADSMIQGAAMGASVGQGFKTTAADKYYEAAANKMNSVTPAAQGVAQSAGPVATPPAQMAQAPIQQGTPLPGVDPTTGAAMPPPPVSPIDDWRNKLMKWMQMGSGGQ
jgi:hypothetical protein